jgi:esterase/lipase superfamily enzyme
VEVETHVDVLHARCDVWIDDDQVIRKGRYLLAKLGAVPHAPRSRTTGISPGLGREMGVVVFGHYGPPMIAFPTTGGDEWEYERTGVIDTISGFIDAGRVKVFCVNTNNADSFGNGQAHPRHRSWMQAQYDDYITHEVMPFVRSHCRSHDIAMWTFGASLGGYHARQHALQASRRREALLRAVGRLRHDALHGRRLRRQLLLQQPGRLHVEPGDRWTLAQLSSCDIHLATARGRGSIRKRPTGCPASSDARGVRHSLDDWGPQGGHDWPYWRT